LRSADLYAVLSRTTRLMSNFSTGDEGFSRRTTGVDAGAAKQVALDYGHGHARGGEPVHQRGARLPGAHDDRIEFLIHFCWPFMERYS
jgi:hypothetical protein